MKKLNMGLWVVGVLFCVQSSALTFKEPWEALKERLRGPRVGAHQGDMFSGRQNTLWAFESARLQGVDIVEMDLRITKDGVPVIYHDEKLQSFTKCRGSVRDFTLEEVKQCEFYNTSDTIPSFEEVLQWANGRVVVDAEFKDTETILPAVELVQKYSAHSWTYFQTQSSEEKYQIARDADSQVILLFRISNQETLQWALNLKDPALLFIEVEKGTRKPEWLKMIKDSGKLVTEDAWHWSLLQELFGATCKQAFQAGIDVAITNRPEGCSKQRDQFGH